MDDDNTTIAERYDRARQLPEATLEIWIDAIAELTKGHPIEIILDVGCGTGRFSAGLADKLGAVVIGMDPSDTMLREARRKDGSVGLFDHCAKTSGLTIEESSR